MRRATITNNQQNSLLTTTGGTNVRLSIGQNESIRRRDPKVLRDKQNMQNSMTILETFLIANGYQGKTQLSYPSSKEVQTIFCFLISFIDPYFKLSARYEEDVIATLKLLKYPYVSEINRSQLIAVTPHTWPVILAMLQWIVELIGYMQKDLKDKVEVTSYFYEFVTNAYLKFLDNQDDNVLEEEYRNKAKGLCESKCNDSESKLNLLNEIELKIKKLESENKMTYEEFDKELLNLSGIDSSLCFEKKNNVFKKENQNEDQKYKQMTKLQYLQQKIKELENEKMKYSERAKQYEIKTKNTNSSLGKMELEISEQVKENATIKNEVDNLRAQIEVQSIKPEKLNEINVEKINLYRDLEKVKPLNESLLNELKVKKDTIKEKEEYIEKLIEDFTSLYSDNPLIYILKGNEQFITIQGDGNEQKKIIEDKISEKDNVIGEIDEELIYLETKNEELMDELEDLNEKKNQKENIFKGLSRSYLQRKENFEKSKRTIYQELESLNEMIITHKNESYDEILTLNNTIEKKKIHLERTKKMYLMENERLENDITDLKNHLTNQYEEINASLNNFESKSIS